MKTHQFVTTVVGIVGHALTISQWEALEALYQAVQAEEIKTITVSERIDCELPPEENNPTLWAEAYIRRQIEWSARTFGLGHRTVAIASHINREILEVFDKPHDLEEWIDIIILGLDGAWRCGKERDYSELEIIEMLNRKQQKNFERAWVRPEDPNQPCEHQREDGNGNEDETRL